MLGLMPLLGSAEAMKPGWVGAAVSDLGLFPQSSCRVSSGTEATLFIALSLVLRNPLGILRSSILLGCWA